MDFMSFKTYVWPRNPTTYKEECVREPQYYVENGRDYFDHMGDIKRIITGTGVFFGADAVAQFQALAEMLDSDEPGTLRHPLWGNRHCYFTGLELTQEPKDQCVNYKFQFTGALNNGVVPK